MTVWIKFRHLPSAARRFETTNGIKHEEVGQVFSGPLPQTGVLSTEGRSSWHDPTGMQIVLYWHADENGYQPLVSDHRHEMDWIS